jgi:hypothetical protein
VHVIRRKDDRAIDHHEKQKPVQSTVVGAAAAQITFFITPKPGGIDGPRG